MNKSEPKYRKALNTDQLEVLVLLSKFRFGSNTLIADYFGKKDRSFVFKRLKILEDQGLIGKRFDSSYRIKGKPAAYYLKPDGARLLQDKLSADIKIKNLYKEATVSEEFVGHSLSLLKVYLELRRAYSDNLKFFAKNELAEYDYFPDPLPDAYIRLKTSQGEKQFFLELFHSYQPYYYKKRARFYMNYADEELWEGSDDLPIVLFVCDSTALRMRAYKQIAKINHDEGLTIALTDEVSFISGTGGLWELLDKPGEFKHLEAIS